MIFRKLSLRLTRDYRCAHLVEVVTDYLEGTMPLAERTRFDRHLKRCKGCRSYVEQLRRTIEQCGRVTVDDVEALPEHVREELMDAFRALHAGR
jgi:predicted anti-sigma-YlaC factor YlaD